MPAGVEAGILVLARDNNMALGEPFCGCFDEVEIKDRVIGERGDSRGWILVLWKILFCVY
ncbi:MAG: hypothetical protein A2Y62_12720 [Candidatus Fischerbacteria bacterium RBG_13_37_8]|uniref:Uncharacterized protein n=1 Tax=Candidatus Fischerbacteria bacterium RBG_13_37_8 TaxID=1817863 RepID=A0A1F5VQ88_9BACT|nr:MAG: hypothetical protein A2Y62_12720 [Candidatus Fischerbacteria bacterium RBG_13_37_8]